MDDLTEKRPFLFRLHMKVSLFSCRSIKATLATRLCHCTNLFPTSALLKDTLRGAELSISTKVACFLRTIK